MRVQENEPGTVQYLGAAVASHVGLQDLDLEGGPVRRGEEHIDNLLDVMDLGIEVGDLRKEQEIP